jgi:hypothetical protein
MWEPGVCSDPLITGVISYQSTRKMKLGQLTATTMECSEVLDNVRGFHTLLKDVEIRRTRRVSEQYSLDAKHCPAQAFLDE